jgi:hypothetical protein
MRYLFFAIALFIATFCVTFFGIKAIRSAFAHTAIPTAAKPQGWDYPLACCSQNDCSEIRSTAIVEGPNGYTITLTPEDHHMLVEPKTYQVSYGDPKIKDSPDGVFHICISRQSPSVGSTPSFGGGIICLFIPPRGF